MITHKTITTLTKAGAFALIGMFTMMSTSSAANITLAGTSFEDATTAMGKIATFNTLDRIIVSGKTTGGGGNQKLTEEAEGVLTAVAKLKTAAAAKLAHTVAETFWKVLICRALPEFVTTFFTGITKDTTTQILAEVKTAINVFIGNIAITGYTLAIATTTLTVTKADGTAVAIIQLGEKSFDALITKVAEKLVAAKDFTIDMLKLLSEHQEATLTIIQDLPVTIGTKTTTIKAFVDDTTANIFDLIDKKCTQLITDNFAKVENIRTQRQSVEVDGQKGAGAVFNTAFRTAIRAQIATAVNTLDADITV